MGLEYVEMVMELERRFDIEFDEGEAGYFLTVGALYDYLRNRCAGRGQPGCPTRRAFYRLRQAFVEVLGLDRQSLRPATELSPLLSRYPLHVTWNRLARKAGMRFPPLADRTGSFAACGAFLAMAIAFTAGTFFTGDVFEGIAMALMSCLIGVLLGYMVGLCWFSSIPPETSTLGDLARVAVALNYSQFQDSAEPPAENDAIWQILCDVLADVSGIRREQLTRDTRFVEDLGF